METKVRDSLKETDIRPDELMGRAKEAAKQDLNWLLDRYKDFIWVKCPACGSYVITNKAITKNELVYVECLDCATIYMNPRPTPELLQEFYIQSYNYRYWNEYIFPASEEVRRERIFQPRAQYVDKMVKRYSNAELITLMDIGAGFGTFCEEVKKLRMFQHVIALEPTPDLAKTCREHGLEVIEKPFEQLKRDTNTVDVITAFEVLEHIFDPAEFIEHCSHLLNESGLLILTCPNINGFETKLLGTHSSTIGHGHLNYFHPSSLCLLLRRFGFEILTVTTPGKLDVDIVRKHIEDADICPFLKYIIMDEQIGEDFQKFLATNMLSSHMQVVARKCGGCND